MGTSTLDNIKEKEISPKEIREMLGIDNSQIQELCKMADIKLKRNSYKTYRPFRFSYYYRFFCNAVGWNS